MKKLFTVTKDGFDYVGYKHHGFILHKEEKEIILDIEHFDTEKEMIDFIFGGDHMKK